MKKLVSLALALALMATAFTGCSKGTSLSSSEAGTASAATSGTTAGKTLNVCVGPEPESIDPSLNQAVDVTTEIQHMFEGLTKYTPDGYVNAEAKSIDKSADGKTYTIKLRDDIKWSDGKAVTAQDYVYAWQRTVDPKTASPYNYIFDPVVNATDIYTGKNKDVTSLGVKAVDDKTLEVKLTAPCPYFNELLSFTAYGPLRKDVVEGNDKWTQDPKTYISNGPYKLQSWSHKDSLVVTKNPYYYDKDKVTWDSIKFVLLEDDTAILAAYQNGEIDFAYPLSVAEIPAWKDKADFHNDSESGITYFEFNVNKKPFDNAKVRQALSLAVDRNYIVTKVTKADQTVAGGFVPPTIKDADTSKTFRSVGGDYFSPKAEDYEKNVAQAKQLLSEAGYPNGKGFPTFEYSTNPGSANQAVAEALQNMWKTELGINCTIATPEWATFIANRNKGDFQVARGGWNADYNDPMTFLNLFVTGGGNNDPKYSNKDYDALIQKAMTTDDNTIRMPAFHDAEAMLMKDMPVVPLYYATRVYLRNPKMQNYYMSPFGFDYFMYTTEG